MRDKIVVLNSRERKHIRQKLNEQFGVEEIPKLVYFCLNKKEKVYVCTREIFDIPLEEVRLNAFGMHFGTIMKDGFRLSIEGSQLIGPHATQHIFSLDKDQQELWLQGRNIETNTNSFERAYMLMKHETDFIGTGKEKKGKIINYIPKSRSLKNVFSSEEIEENCLNCENQ